VGPHCSFCGTFTGPFSEVEGLFTVLICIPCLEVRQAQRTCCLASTTRATHGNRCGCPIQGCGKWFIGPWDLEWHTAAEHPGWMATYKLAEDLMPFGNNDQRDRAGHVVPGWHPAWLFDHAEVFALSRVGSTGRERDQSAGALVRRWRR
jgi:hypothetical protein